MVENNNTRNKQRCSNQNYISRRGALRALGTSAIIGLAGCAQQGGNEGNNSSGGAQTNQGSIEVTIGNIQPTSGVAGAYGQEINNAVRLAADQAMNAGEVDNVELLFGDSQYDPATARKLATEQLSDGADVIHGALSSAGTVAVSAIAERENIPQVGRSGELTLDLRKCRPTTFAYSPSIPGWTANGVGYCLNNDLGNSVYTIGYDYNWPQDTVTYLKNELLPEMGAENAGVSLLQLGSSDFSGPLTKAKNTGADIINLNMTGSGFLTAYSQANELGLLDENVIITNGGGNSTLAKNLSEELRTYENLYLGLEWHRTIGSEGAEQFAQEFQSRYGKVPQVSAVSYAGVRTLLEAIGDAGTTDTGAVVSALENRELTPQIWGTGESWRGCDHRFKIPAITATGLPDSADNALEVVNINDNYDQLTIDCGNTICQSDNGPDWFEQAQ